MTAGSTLRVSAELENLWVVRRFVEHRAAALGADPDALSDVVFAANELATNTIVHGYCGRPGRIEIEMGQKGDGLVVRLRDRAPPFDPHETTEPDLTLPLEQRPLGGLGIYMTLQLVDKLLHRVTPEGENEVILIKRDILNHS